MYLSLKTADMFGMKPSIWPSARSNNLWLNTRRVPVLIAVVGWKKTTNVWALKLWKIDFWSVLSRHETHSHVRTTTCRLETTWRGLPRASASPFRSTLCPGWDSTLKGGTGDSAFGGGGLCWGAGPSPLSLLTREGGCVCVCVCVCVGAACESQCDWFQIEERGGGSLLCLAVTLHPAQSVGEGSSGPQPGRTMGALQA